jgi:hypothetical protein
VLKDLHWDLPRIMELHGNQLSHQDKTNCFQLLTLCQQQAVFEDVWDLLDERLELIDLYCQSEVRDKSGDFMKFIKAFAMFPFEHTKQKFVSLKSHLESPPTDLINLTDYLGKSK